MKGARILTGLLGAAWLSGCANVEREFPNKSADAYRIDQAKIALDKYKFDMAIENIGPVLAKKPKDPEVAYVASAAYAGRAGLRILDLFSELARKVSTTALLAIFAEHYISSDDDRISDIETAKDIIEGYGERAADLDPDMNFFALFVFYSRIGVTLNRYGYTADTTDVDPAFKACSVSKFPDAAVDTVMTSLPRIIDTASAVAAAGAGFDDLKGLTLPIDLGWDPIPCSANSNNIACLAVRNLVAQSKAEGGFGLGTGEYPCLTTTP